MEHEYHSSRLPILVGRVPGKCWLPLGIFLAQWKGSSGLRAPKLKMLVDPSAPLGKTACWYAPASSVARPPLRDVPEPGDTHLAWLSCPFGAVSPNNILPCYHCEFQYACLLAFDFPSGCRCSHSLQTSLLHTWEKTTTCGKCTSGLWALSHASEERHTRHHEISREYSSNSRWAWPQIHRRVTGRKGKACPHSPGPCFGLWLKCDPRPRKCQGLLLLAIPRFRYWPSQDSKLETAARYRHLHIAGRGLYVYCLVILQLQVMLFQHQPLSTEKSAS